jgi:hypothetical protein
MVHYSTLAEDVQINSGTSSTPSLSATTISFMIDNSSGSHGVSA